MPTLSLALLAAALVACGGDGTGTGDTLDTSDVALSWYTTCGDPACSSYRGPFDGVDLCTDEQAEDSCAERDASCDPVNDCNALLICTDEDPKAQPGGCPVSRAEHKEQVHYLDPLEVAAVGERLQQVRLATWRYRWAADDDATQLGFVIGDPAVDPAVRPDLQQVDLYAWTSMAVAGLQSQAAALAALEARLAALEAGRCDPAP